MTTEKIAVDHTHDHDEAPIPANTIEKSTADTPTTLDELKKTATIDTLHNDEAVRVLATYAGDETWTPAEEKRVVRKIDRRLLPLLILTYGHH